MRDFDAKYRQLKRLDNRQRRIREKYEELTVIKSLAADRVRGGGRYDLADVVARQESLLEEYKKINDELTYLQADFLWEMQRIESPLYQKLAALRFIKLDRRPLYQLARELDISPLYAKQVSSRLFNFMRADDDCKPPLPSVTYKDGC